MFRWFLLGCFGRLVSWPIGYIFVAKGMGKVFACTESFANGAHVALILICLNLFGLVGASIAFFILYVSYCGLLLFVSHLAADFYWSASVVRLLLVIVPTIAVTFLLPYYFSSLAAQWLGGVISLAAGGLCLKGLLRRLGPDNRIHSKLGVLGLLARKK